MAYTSIDDPEAYFQAVTYTGNGSTQSITLPGSTDMQPDLIWIKERNAGSSHAITDSVRGTTKKLKSDDTDAEETNTNLITSFDSDGFGLGDNGNSNQSASQTYVAWCWKESATAGFDIVGYTGNATNRTISHSLSAVPGVVLVKSRGGVFGYGMYHHRNTSAPETDYLSINNSDATVDDSVFWNDTAPTSSVFSLGTTDAINKNTITHIAYCWAEKQGFSKFGTYTGNGNADGTFIHTGFRVAWLMVKRSDNSSAGEWIVFDNKRGANTYNPVDVVLCASNAQTEADWGTNYDCDFTANGFKWRWNGSADRCNGNNNTYVYMAFAEAPFVNSNGVPGNAR